MHGSDAKPPGVPGHHAQALGAEDLDEIVADYSDDAVFIPAGVQRGKDGIRQAFTKLLREVPQATTVGASEKSNGVQPEIPASSSRQRLRWAAPA